MFRKSILTIVSLFTFHVSLSISQETKHSSGDNSWNPDSLGNHRAYVIYEGAGNAVRVIIPWRRKDINPQEKKIIVVDGATNKIIRNVKLNNINREFGDIVFEPISKDGAYYVYFLPYKSEGRSNYPKGIYLKPEETASKEWLNTINLEILKPNSSIQEIQSIDDFNSFYPMEIIATQKETEELIKKNPNSSFLLFPEDRDHPIKMKDDLPYRWIRSGTKNEFTAEACKGEYFSFQIGVYAIQNLRDIKINFSDLKSSSGKILSSKNISCLNTKGVDYQGRLLKKSVKVDKGKVQALWCLADVPKNTSPEKYFGKVSVSCNGESKEINIVLSVRNKIIADGGINEPWKQTRLKWLNSTLAQNNEIIPPYTPIKLNGKTISILGRKIRLNESGLPDQIQSLFTEEMTSYSQQPKNILSAPFNFVIEKENGNINWQKPKFNFTSKLPGKHEWESKNISNEFEITTTGSIEFDGFASIQIKLTAKSEVELKDIRLEIPFSKNSSKYMMGLGQKGGLRPNDFKWKWEVATKNQDGAWIGEVNAGLQFSLRDEKYIRPLNTNFYLQKPLLLPTSWGNNGNGGISVSENENGVLVNNYSGKRSIKKGETLYFNFNLLITPFHTINTDFQWSTRFFHSYQPIDTIKNTGATVINIHHANEINPYINYPFIAHKEMKTYIDEAHSKGLKVKIYNTVRELSNRSYELFAMRSLGHEIYSPGKGGGFQWLQEHVGDDYIAAWFVPELKDAAIINSGMSRWHNYYVEGMNWLVQNVGIDGIYLDDVAFDRITMKRIKRVLTQSNHPGIIDLHSANQYNKNDGFQNSAMLYMEHFPYLNRLWFGEYFDYEKNSPDFFMTEISGIPFGLMGEMLQDGGNPWRGMIYGMTNRMPWTKNSDPRPLWKIWDEFRMKGSKMIGYWVGNNPVKTDNKNVLATVYKKNKSAMISIASWADADTNIKLNIDWKSLGINSSKAIIEAPEINNFQPNMIFQVDDEIPVTKNKGWLLIVKEN